MSGRFLPDQTDLAILNALQDDLPLVSRPWEAVADSLGIAETEMLERMKKMGVSGIIRGISPVLESRPLGLHAATLVALRVPEERIGEVAGIISTYSEVSHNFRRDHTYNLWFTIAAPDREGIRHIMDEILHRTGVPADDVLNLPTKTRIKIDVRFAFLSAQHRGDTFGSD
jgi:DNA-binding Lrp family transcriptional regulator